MHSLSSLHKVDVFALNETWLTKNVMSSNVNIPQFKFFRNDSPSGLPKHGVGLYIRDNIVVGKIFTDHQNTLALHLPEYNVYVLNIYRPPSYSSLESALLFSSLMASVMINVL